MNRRFELFPDALKQYTISSGSRLGFSFQGKPKTGAAKMPNFPSRPAKRFSLLNG
jgi:hypothetical protein